MSVTRSKHRRHHHHYTRRRVIKPAGGTGFQPIRDQFALWVQRIRELRGGKDADLGEDVDVDLESCCSTCGSSCDEQLSHWDSSETSSCSSGAEEQEEQGKDVSRKPTTEKKKKRTISLSTMEASEETKKQVRTFLLLVGEITTLSKGIK